MHSLVYTAQKMKKSLMEKFNFCAVVVVFALNLVLKHLKVLSSQFPPVGRYI